MQKDTPILITGAGGFIGKNLVAALRQAGYRDLMLFEKEDTPDTLAACAAASTGQRTPPSFTPATPG